MLIPNHQHGLRGLLWNPKQRIGIILTTTKKDWWGKHGCWFKILKRENLGNALDDANKEILLGLDGFKDGDGSEGRRNVDDISIGSGRTRDNGKI